MDKNETLTIIVLGTIACLSLGLLGVDAKEIAIAIGSGLIGYLKGKGYVPDAMEGQSNERTDKK